MAEIIEFRKIALARDKNDGKTPSEPKLNTAVRRLWHILAVELYANGYTTEFFSKMNRAARIELLIKALPANESDFYLTALSNSNHLLGKYSLYGFKSKNADGFSECEITELVHNITIKSQSWARAVLINLRNLERQQAELPAGFRNELIADAFKRELKEQEVSSQPIQFLPSTTNFQLDLAFAVAKFLESFPERERTILIKLYNIDGSVPGLSPGDRITYAWAASLTGYSARQVSHSHQKAIRKSRHPSRRRLILPFASQVNPALIQTGTERLMRDIFLLG